MGEVDILEEGVCQLVFGCFERRKFNNFHQEQHRGRCSRKGRGYLAACYERGFPTTQSNDTQQKIPRFLFLCGENFEMLHSGFGYLTEITKIVITMMPQNECQNAIRTLIRCYFLVFALSPLFVLFISCNSTKKEIDDRVQSGVVLIYNTDYYTLTLPDGSVFYFSGDADGKITNVSFDKDDCVQSSMGTGFFISNDGKIATNKHVASRTVSDKSMVKTTKKILNLLIVELEQMNKEADLLQDQIAIAFKQSNDASEKAALKHKYDELSEEIEDNNKLIKILERADMDRANIDYHSTLSVAYNGTFVKSLEDFYPCILRDTSDQDLAIIQLNSKETPEGRYVFSVSEDDMLEHYSFGEYLSRIFGKDKNEKLFLVGFNHGLYMALTGEGIYTQCTEGSISRPEKNRIMYSIATLPGSSGSPVLNQRGQLVAVNYAGIRDGQNFNFGVKAKHLYDMIHKNQ